VLQSTELAYLCQARQLHAATSCFEEPDDCGIPNLRSDPRLLTVKQRWRVIGPHRMIKVALNSHVWPNGQFFLRFPLRFESRPAS